MIPFMKLSIIKLTPVDEEGWQDFVHNHPDSTIYHTLAWRDILYNEYRFEPIYFIAKEGNSVVGVLPAFLIENFRGRRLVSLPFSIYGGPLGETEEVVAALLGRCLEMVDMGRVSEVEIKPYKLSAVMKDNGFASLDWGAGAILDLTVGKDMLWHSLVEKKSAIKGEKKGLEFFLSDESELDQFYSIQILIRKRLGLPVPRMAYYKSFFAKLTYNSDVKLALIKKGEDTVAAGVFFLFRDTILPVLSASLSQFNGCKPNDMLIWNMIKWGVENDYSSFDLSPAPYENKGLLQFKRKWGGDEREVLQYYYPKTSLPSTKGLTQSLARNALRISPKFIHKLAGRQLIKHFG